MFANLSSPNLLADAAMDTIIFGSVYLGSNSFIGVLSKKSVVMLPEVKEGCNSAFLRNPILVVTPRATNDDNALSILLIADFLSGA